MPEKGLEYAERASQMGSGSSYTETLAQAYVANDRYEEALEQLKTTPKHHGTGSVWTLVILMDSSSR